MCLLFVSLYLSKHAYRKTVYQTNSMLEMSNGYPNSTSPLGGSPSPGQSPNMGGHHNKCM